MAMLNSTEMPLRLLGSTGVQVSMLGMGGSHLSKSGLSSNDAVRLIRAALDRGLNFMDNAWDYHDGESERRLGKALKDGYRDTAFVMT
jgi:predicted aldo/keto reductase-like oxidoreductase